MSLSQTSGVFSSGMSVYQASGDFTSGTGLSQASGDFTSKGADDVGEGSIIEGSIVGTGIAVGEKGTEAAAADFIGGQRRSRLIGWSWPVADVCRSRLMGWSWPGVADICRSRLTGWSRSGVADRFLCVPLELLLVLR